MTGFVLPLQPSYALKSMPSSTCSTIEVFAVLDCSLSDTLLLTLSLTLGTGLLTVLLLGSLVALQSHQYGPKSNNLIYLISTTEKQ